MAEKHITTQIGMMRWLNFMRSLSDNPISEPFGLVMAERAWVPVRDNIGSVPKCPE